MLSVVHSGKRPLNTTTFLLALFSLGRGLLSLAPFAPVWFKQGPWARSGAQWLLLRAAGLAEGRH